MRTRAHVHEFTIGESGQVMTCRCGAFRFTPECTYPVVTAQEPRFYPVTIARFIGMYRRNDPKCWAIADRAHANRIHDSRKFDSYDDAKRAADELNNGPEVQS